MQSNVSAIVKILADKKDGLDKFYIIVYQGRYNYWLCRKEKAEEFFNSHSSDECEKYKDLFAEVLNGIDTCRESLETLLNRKLTDSELKNGFNIR